MIKKYGFKHNNVEYEFDTEEEAISYEKEFRRLKPKEAIHTAIICILASPVLIFLIQLFMASQ